MSDPQWDVLSPFLVQRSAVLVKIDPVVPRSGSARNANEHALVSITRGGCFHSTRHPTKLSFFCLPYPRYSVESQLCLPPFFGQSTRREQLTHLVVSGLHPARQPLLASPRTPSAVLLEKGSRCLNGNIGSVARIVLLVRS